MRELRRVEYYVSDMYDSNVSDLDNVGIDDNTNIGLFHTYANVYDCNNGEMNVITRAVIEDVDTGDVKLLEVKQLKRFLR